MATAAGANTLDTLNGLFKEVYAKDIEDLIPDGVKLLTKIQFSKQATVGNFYHQPVVLGMEHGVTFAGSGDDAFSLNDAVPGQLKDATVRGTALVLRSVMGLQSASRSAEGGAKAFKQATKFLIGNMLRSITKKLEIEMLYGQIGYATLAAASATNTISIPAAQWAPGIWAGAEKMPIEQRTSGGTLVKSMNVVSVDFENKTITVDGVATAISANDVLWHKGAYGNEFAGIHKIITNTSTIFGIDASQYVLFKGNEYDAGNAALSFAKIQDAVAKAVEKGLDNDVMVVVNPMVWSDLLTDQAALRKYDSSYSSAKMENGAKEVKFHGQNGVIEIVPSIYCKQGFAYVISPDEMMRIGSSDVTFRRPGKGDEFFRELENHAGYELRCYTDQALFCHSPGKNVLIKNIV
jgi:hypothetical protein